MVILMTILYVLKSPSQLTYNSLILPIQLRLRSPIQLGYTSAPAVVIEGGGGEGAQAET